MPEISDYKNRLSTLIEGYEGYESTSKRKKTCEVFEAFVREKLRIIHRILEDRYNEFLKEKKNLHLLIPLSGLIKNFVDSNQYISFEKKERMFFFNEYRFPEDFKVENLYLLDFQILQQMSIIVDKITHFEEESKNKFEKLLTATLVLKKKLSDRKNLIYGINEKLIPVNKLIHSIVQDIRERRISDETCNNIQQAIKMFPMRLNTYMEIFHAFFVYSSFYTKVHENIPLLDFFDQSKLFVKKYSQFVNHIKDFISKYNFSTEEEIECRDYLVEKLAKVPNFYELEKEIDAVKKEAEMKQARRRHEEEIIRKATIEYNRGLKFENEMRYVEAIALYEKTLSIDDKYMEAKEAIERCKKKKKALPYYVKATRKLQIGQIKKAISLLNKALKKAPEFQEAKDLLEKLKAKYENENK